MRTRDDETNVTVAFDRRAALALLALTGAAFLLYNWVFVFRLTNNHFADIEFSGWSGLMGSRLLKGERPYIDFVLPIPPGSFALLAGIEWLNGRSLLLQELWLNTVIQLALGGIAYLMVVPFTSRKIAVLSAIATLMTVVQLNKECAYDHTAQLLSWISFTVAVRALLTADAPIRARRWTTVGVLAGSTLFFKQSTAVGAVFAWPIALSYLMAVEALSKQAGAAMAWLRDLWNFARGVAWGLMLVWFGLIALGSTATAFFQAVFVDAAELKGGLRMLVSNVSSYLLSFPSYPASLATIVVLALIAFRLVRKRGGMDIGDEPHRTAVFRRLDVAFVAAIVVLHFGVAIYFLKYGPPGYRADWIFALDRLKQVPTIGLLFSAAFFVTQLVRVGGEPRPLIDDPARMGHVINAVFLAALAASILHNTSAPEFRPFYDNNPIVPFAFMALFVALDRAELPWATALFFVLALGSLYGNRYYRAMTATIPAKAGMHWDHLRINPRGLVIQEAAVRARELAGPKDTVLVLPEDLQLTALVGRPRPPLLGACVFVDQYASRLADDDIARLGQNPPKVIILHPRQTQDWQRFFRIWSGRSGAESVVQYVLNDLIPSHYRLDRSWQTTFLWQMASLDLYVRDDDDAEPQP